MKQTGSLLSDPFNSEEFRREGHKLIDLLAEYLDRSLKGQGIPVYPWNDPDELVEKFRFDSGTGRDEPFDQFIDRIIHNSNHLHHPRYIGHQVTSPLPLTALVQFCTTLLNNGAAVYEMGPVNMAMERNVINRFGTLIGYGHGYDGIFTHGGTAGNLTAMLTARQIKSDHNIWEEGIKDSQRPGFLLSEQSHYSISRNIRIMGLGAESAIHVPCDKNYRMRVDMLDEMKKKAENKGIKVISVVASACSTATGSYDDLSAIADFCKNNDLWMHVDGAHGMGALFSEKYRDRLRGIERADSIVIDFHKMFLIPAINTMVIYRNGENAYEAFDQKASYLFRKTDENAWIDSAKRTIECTKSSLGIIAYTALKYYGDEYYRKYIESRYDLTSDFASVIKSSEIFELAAEPQANIICFRFAPHGYDNETLNYINSVIRKKIVMDGTFYIVTAELNGILYLRLTIINPLTSEDDLTDLLYSVRETGEYELKKL